MARFDDISGGEVRDTETDLIWTKVPTAPKLWDEAVASLGSGKRIPTLAEMKTLINGQKDAPADFAAAFGEDNAPVDWYWVEKSNKADELQGEPGHFAAWFNWEGNQPRNRRILEALLREVE